MSMLLRESPRCSGTEQTLGLESLVAVLGQLRDLLRSMTDEQYVAKPGGVISSSVGGHVRHCLDHVDSLLSGIGDGAMSYDDRRRGTDVETCRSAALAAIKRQTRQLSDLFAFSPDWRIRLEVLLAANGLRVVVDTSLGRELVFVMSHTVHHNALIGVIAKLLGVAVPDRFGYAPSTLAYQDKGRCAR